MNFCVLGSLFLMTQMLQDTDGLSPLRAGALLLPGMLPLPLLGTTAGRLTTRFGPWRTSALGLSILTPAVVAAALQTLPSASGFASGAGNTARQTGAALGVAVFSALAGDASADAFPRHAEWLLVAAAVAFAAVGVFAHVFVRTSGGASGRKSVIPARPEPNRDLASSGRPSLPEALSQGAHSPPNIG